ncbi:MAG: hypothetical protein C4293_06420 [Nitrospiraceae bacterium]
MRTRSRCLRPLRSSPWISIRSPAIERRHGRYQEHAENMIDEETLRSIETAFMCEKSNREDLLRMGDLQGLAWGMYGILVCDDTERVMKTIEALRQTVKTILAEKSSAR